LLKTLNLFLCWEDEDFMKILMVLKLYVLMVIRSDCFIDSHHPCDSIHANRFSLISREEDPRFLSATSDDIYDQSRLITVRTRVVKNFNCAKVRSHA